MLRFLLVNSLCKKSVSSLNQLRSLQSVLPTVSTDRVVKDAVEELEKVSEHVSNLSQQVKDTYGYNLGCIQIATNKIFSKLKTQCKSTPYLDQNFKTYIDQSPEEIVRATEKFDESIKQVMANAALRFEEAQGRLEHIVNLAKMVGVDDKVYLDSLVKRSGDIQKKFIRELEFIDAASSKIFSQTKYFFGQGYEMVSEQLKDELGITPEIMKVLDDMQQTINTTLQDARRKIRKD